MDAEPPYTIFHHPACGQPPSLPLVTISPILAVRRRKRGSKEDGTGDWSPEMRDGRQGDIETDRWETVWQCGRVTGRQGYREAE